MATKFGRHSNLQCFLNSTTPSVLSHSFSKPCIKGLKSLRKPTGEAELEYFNIGDLWDLFYEWSAYGVGVPVKFPGGEIVVQYYVPYLSAMQIYTSKSLVALRTVIEDSESDYWSDDSEGENYSKLLDAISVDSSIENDAPSSMNLLGCLYLQYFEDCPPWGRIPLMGKSCRGSQGATPPEQNLIVTELSQSYPDLMTFKSTDLSPASWMSIAWYPIYHIPARKYAEDLSASFFTFHTISSSFQDNLSLEVEKETFSGPVCKIGKRIEETSNFISLAPFGLATYKMQGRLWINPETFDNEKILALYSSANSWLNQLRVYHHDFNFFISRAI